MQVELRIPPETREYLKEMPRGAKRGLIRGMRKGMFLAEKAAKESFGKPQQLKVGTGHLRANIRSQVKEEGESVVGSLGSNVIYAAIHEMGGVIRARGTNYLKFRVGGEWKTVRQVVIPERPYLRPAIVDNISEISDIIAKEIERELEEK